MNLVFTTILAILAGFPSGSPHNGGDKSKGDITVKFDTLGAASISSSFKQVVPISEESAQVTTIFAKEITDHGILAPKGLSAMVPNFYIPDYGSSMTSTIYVRGFGSRIDNPVISLYVDDVPVMDKNNYDFDFLDIRRIDLLRGPQGTLYGRNSMVGVLSVSTFSPGDLKGGRVAAEYGSGKSLRANASYYWKDYGLALAFRHSDGFYTNSYDDSDCDPYDGASLRLRFKKTDRGGVRLDGGVSLSWLKQGGWPYRRLSDSLDAVTGKNFKILLPVNYNDDCSYERLNGNLWLKASKETEKTSLTSVTSFQYLYDLMRLDQDFTSKSMFTMKQMQHQYALTQELAARPKGLPEWLDGQAGVFAMVKYNDMDAPVTFKEDGINSLILGNANSHIPPSFGYLAMDEDDFTIRDNFDILTWDLALYDETYFKRGKWLLTAGLRADLEGGHMDYSCNSLIHYQFLPGMTKSKAFETKYEGGISETYFQLLPKLGLTYKAGEASFWGSLCRGWKGGGFNTQIFSDILQNKMMYGLMDDLGVHFDNEVSVSAKNTRYKPEKSWDFEAGARWSRRTASGHVFDLSGSLYYILSTDQQLTVFPKGQSTGRMMTNAGRSKSCGAEAEALWSWKGLALSASYGYTHATFTEYVDGNDDWAGNRIPYAPQSTLFLRAAYTWKLSRGPVNSISASGNLNRVGKIWWNEANSLSQDPYWLAGADINVNLGRLSVFARTENLTGTGYQVFYFKSVGNSFFQKGKPARASVGIRLDF
jgi:iron complex outermembrane receptor protein